MASSFTGILEQVGQLHKADDDFIDRLNHRFTVILLVTFASLISAKQFIGEPISCWAPAHFSGPQITYTNSICWLKGTYYLEEDRSTIPQQMHNTEFHIAYYQFIPYMLLTMAALFYVPHMLWRSVSRSVGFDLRSLIQDVKKVSNVNIHQVALEIHTALIYNSSESKSRRSFRYFSSQHNPLSMLGMFVKLFYLLNCFGQFFLLSKFLSFPFFDFGYERLKTITLNIHAKANDGPKDSKWFPRVVMCEFMVRHLGSNQHRMAVQCNLPINLFNELVFILLWAWLIMVTALTCVSFVLYVFNLFNRFAARPLYKYLRMNSPELRGKLREKFVNEYARQDGALVLRIIAQNTNDAVMANLVGALFEIYAQSVEETSNDYDRDKEIPSRGHYTRIENNSF